MTSTVEGSVAVARTLKSSSQAARVEMIHDHCDQYIQDYCLYKLAGYRCRVSMSGLLE